jgi:tetratricopeptide (TPR) repeat protein
MAGNDVCAQAKFALSEPPFRRACEIDPKELDVCYYWARTLFSLSRFDAALRAYEKDVRPWRGKTLLGMALALDALNRELDAENMYREAVASGDAFEDVTLVSESQRQACRGRGGRT